MGRHSSCLKQKLRKGLWSPEEDEKLFNHITLYGVGCWSSVPKLAGLQRCGKSCRLRWINYLRPDLKRGMFSQQEEDLILRLHQVLGNRWAQIATQLPGRTDNEIKNFWNSYLKKKLMKQGIDPGTHKPFTRDQIEVKSENSNYPTTDTEPSLPPPSVFRPSEPAFLLGDPTIDFSLQHGIGPNKAFFNLSPVLEFHRFVTSHPVNYSTSLLAGHRQCQDTRTRPTNVAGHCGMIGEESASSDGLASKMSSPFFDEAITTDDPRTKNIAGYQMNGDLEDNSGAFSWGSDYIDKLDPSSNQFQPSTVIKSNEAMKRSQWSHQEEPIVTSYNALDFGDYPLTSISEDFDVLPDL